MATNFRSLDEIVLAMLDYLRVVQPDLDTKPGSVARDVTIDAPASEISKLYIELKNIQNKQSIASAVGRELDLLARNFGLVRGSGSPSSGIAVFTTNTLDYSIVIPEGTVVTSRTGVSFKVMSETIFDSAKSNIYRSNAIRLRSELDIVGISDIYAIEISVEAASFGLSGNIGKYSIISHSVAGISNVSNLEQFSGGTNAENDTAFRSRILGIFAGSNVGTTLGYTNTLLASPSVADVFAVEPGDPLMIRDGTDISTNSAGEAIIISPGTGGKVDLYILGSSLEEFTESYIYKDKSGKNDSTNLLNDFILGQRSVNPLLDFQQRRKLLVEARTLPFQPVSSIFSLSGSLSGPNFRENFIDADGQVKGSFELIKDTAAFGGSPFGFDKIHFISNEIELEDESISKGPLNGEDALDYTDVQEISKVRQQIVITNEQPEVSSSDRSILTLKHTPVLSTNSVLNVTTGQRYRIENQNFDDTLGGNTTGRIKISGGTLPTANDVLQASYIWNRYFDNSIDFDNIINNSIFRTAQDSVDWGFSNKVVKEEQVIAYSMIDGYHVITNHPISRVTNVNQVIEESATNVSGKLVLANSVTNIVSVQNTLGKEMFYTELNNGTFSNLEVTLPTDTLSLNGDSLTVIYNSEDLYDTDSNFTGSTITLAESGLSVGVTVFVDYVANLNSILPTTALNLLPVTGQNNEFNVDGDLVGTQPITNLYSGSTFLRNLRFAPSYLKFDFQGILSVGKISISGISFIEIDEIVTVRKDGLTLDLSDAIKAYFNTSTVSQNGYVGYVDKVERVTMSGDIVESVDYEYDLLNYELMNVTYSNSNAFQNLNLNRYDAKLMSTTENSDESPITGITLRVKFYWVDLNANERLVVSSSGTQYSKYKYAFVNTISLDSGFLSLSNTVEGTFSVVNSNQPVSGTTYLTTYKYTAPKEGERITISYNYNRLLGDLLYDLEPVRPITADVLIKEAKNSPLDITVRIVALPNYNGGEENLKQSVLEAITSFVSGNGLGATIDNDDLIVAIHNIAGVDRVTLTNFNKKDLSGVKQSLVAENNEYFSLNNVEVVVEDR